MAEPSELFAFNTPVENADLDAGEVRDNFTALARTHYTTDPANPLAPQDGMLRINASDVSNKKLEAFLSGAWREMIQNIGGGVAVPSKQIISIPGSAPLATWTVDHNLGTNVVALVFDASWRQLRQANTPRRHVVPVAWVDLATLVAPVPIRIAMPTPLDGVIRRTWFFSSHVGILGAPAMTLDFLINTVPVTGGTLTVAPLPPATRVDGAPITGTNTVVKGNDDVDMIASVVGAPGAAGDYIEVYMELEEGLQADEYYMDQPTANRIVVTHPTAKAGFVVLIG